VKQIKDYLEKFTYFFCGITIALIFAWFFAPNWERRFVLYHIRGELRKEMSKAEVEEIISRHQTPYLRRIETENGVNLLVHLGLADTLSLVIGFSDDKLKGAKLAGEDSPMDVPKDAPSDIE